jgi:protein-S-isoprenylcysteine O-methyltransferase Ste14
MSASDIPNNQRSKRANIPRWVSPIIGAVGIGVVHILFPWGISLLSTRYGLVDGRPGLWNWPALILVVAGLACVIWCFGLHFLAAPQGWVWERTPEYMLIKGPYRYTRNPMYLFELVLWLGWALFYGSVAVFFALVIIGAVFTFIMVPSEERRLDERFGERYRQYKQTVPRWLGKIRR